MTPLKTPEVLARDIVGKAREELGLMVPGDTTFHKFWEPIFTEAIQSERSRCEELEKKLDKEFTEKLFSWNETGKLQADRQELLKEIDGLKLRLNYFDNWKPWESPDIQERVMKDLELVHKDSIQELLKEIEVLNERLAVCTGCGHLNSPVLPPALACCPDSRYKTAIQLLVEFDEVKEINQELLSGIKVGVEVLKPLRSFVTKELNSGCAPWYADKCATLRYDADVALTTLNKLVEKYK